MQVPQYWNFPTAVPFGSEDGGMTLLPCSETLHFREVRLSGPASAWRWAAVSREALRISAS
jgi:hypothetical protein